MANEPLADFLNYLITNFKSKKTIVTDNDNIVIGEIAGIESKKDTFFPRLEILVNKLKMDGYLDQRNMEQSFRFTVVGFIKRDDDSVTDSDMFDLVKFARETIKIIHQANTDRRNGVTVCDGFQQIDGFTEVHLVYEEIPKMSTFVLEGDANIQLEDTFTNN